MKTRVWNWIKNLDTEPIVAQTADGTTVVITARDVLLLIGGALYSPVATFRAIGIILDDAMAGSYAYLVLVVSLGNVPALDSACSPDASLLSPLSRDTLTGVLCGDGEDISGRNLTYWSDYIGQQTTQSSVMGAFWSQIRMACSSWALHAKYTFRGPFTTPKPTRPGEKPVPGRPAAPILFTSNRLDPVTPLSAARKMAAAHPGAQVLTQEAMGHCALFSGYSPCTRRVVADYFDTGEVPGNETNCEIECGPWDEGCTGMGVAESKHVAEVPWFARRLPLGIF